MKHAVLRAAVHNALDSVTSGCSLAFHLEDYDFPFWMLVWNMPDGKLEVDLMTGAIVTPVPLKAINAYRRLRRAFAIVANAMPDFLRQHGCNPNLVEGVMVRFETNRFRQQQVAVTVTQTNGKTSTDFFAGIPLRRRKVLDKSGRIRRA